ncbi:putative ATP-dependent helicase C29A10.10c [Golovinomyces cichoracearum]|uniref:Putative ATP-dependent helicase C29A10.10c n=1 Tax=Golovinomyces cichoracearum TaxID=62708 RepID=A0A420I431_9PEZI|nr:putative ATP-dependent helicase C29A10.10c [Golovinomyces cichoracearum]
MKEEVEIMNELHGLDVALKSFPSQVHWFCPKQNDDDFIDYTNLEETEEDVSIDDKKERLDAFEKRYQVAYKCSLVLGMAPEQAGRMLKEYTGRLNQLLSSCDKCVYNWHLGRRAFLKEMSEQFDDEIVAGLTRRLNNFDFQRLDTGLEIAHRLLAEVEVSKRTQSYLALNDTTALIALYEAICCIDFHKDDTLLATHFDFVFSCIQSRKVLRISDTLPAMARFLFSRDEIRQRFSRTSWRKMSRYLTAKEFEWVVHDVLMEKMLLVALPNANPIDIENFWVGFLLMLKKMDELLMTHSLSGMEIQPNIYHLALQHLHCNSGDVVRPVIESIYVMIEVAPKAFWSAMGTISPFTVVELVLNSPGLAILLNDPKTFEDGYDSVVTSWIPIYLNSLSPIHQYDACRALCLYLFDRLQDSKYLSRSRMACLYAGLKALYSTLQTFISPAYRINASTSLIVIGDIMGLVDKYKLTVSRCADLPDSDERSINLKAMGRAVIQSILTLDCKAVSSEWAALVADSEVQRGSRIHSQGIWQAVLDIFRPGSIDLAKHILPSTNLLTGIDELRPENKKFPERLPTNHVQFNKDFHELMDNVARIFERLSDFSAEDLIQLPKEPTTARPLFAALISMDQGVHEAAVELIKAMTREDGRVDALRSLLDTDFCPLLGSLNTAVIKVSCTKTFGSTPHIIKIGRELLTSLCGSTGLLRARSEFSSVERNSIMGWWTGQWRALDVIFSCTEEWGERVVKPTSEMTDFLRDCMEYAEALFNSYNIFASALKGHISTPNEISSNVETTQKESLIRILNIICQNINGFVGMLRLRDYYLISVAINLLVKLLRCLGDFDLEVHEFASTFIKDACKGETQAGYRKTNLSNQQKAELRRALDDHQGIEIIEEPKVSIKKQATIDSWSKSADGKQYEPKLPVKVRENFQSANFSKNRTSLSEIRARSVAVAHDSANEQSVAKFKERRRQAEEESRRNRAEAVARAKALRAPNSVRGEGSGIKDISGITGKDHAPKSSELLCGSSDSESDDDNDDEANALVNIQKTRNQKVSEYEASRRLNLLQPQGPVKKTKIQRSAKDLRARVEPNMDKLYQEILNWDLFHHGDEPPSNNICRKIENRYLDLNLYKSTFGPLLISEVWRSFVTAKEENNFRPVEIKVLNRLSVDKFIEVSTSIPIASDKDAKISERDIVLLSRSPDPMNNQEEPHCLARVDRTTRKKDVLETTYRISRDIRQELLQFLVPNGKLYVVKITDMTTTQREYAALSSLEYYDLCNEVLEAKPSPHQKYSQSRITSTVERYQLNVGQAKAILSAYENDGFTLVQGPPGSGKTKTIIAMVGALLTQTLQQQQAAEVKNLVKNNPAQKNAPVKKKLLICAPSNAAVDELVIRLMDGVKTWNGSSQKINVIRIGRSDAVNASVKSVMLEELVKKKLEGQSGEQNKLINDRDKLHQEAAKVKERLNVIRPLMDEARKNGETAQELNLRREFDQLKRSQASIGAKIDEEKASGNTVSRQNEINRRQFQQEIIDSAHILCSTLSGSGHDMFRNLNVEFETVIIDEAAQCIELSALIPLKYGCSKCILVGDPEQLPPTVLSRSAASYGYEQSLFIRMQRNYPKDVHLLDIQYRMHPEISVFPSREFYSGRLVDGENMALLRDKPWHMSTILGPYRFFDVKGTQSKEARGHSLINIPELNAAIALYERLKADFCDYDFRGKIGIITTYKAQLIEMRLRFERRFGENIHEEIEFNTTDAFQGREREIIIFSCVRAKSSGGIGFLGDIRRMNVGLTRAKSSLWVLGDSSALQQGEYWNKLIQDAKERDRYSGGDITNLLRKRTTHDRKDLREFQINEASTVKSQHNTLIKTEIEDFTHDQPVIKKEDIEITDKLAIRSPTKSSVDCKSDDSLSSRQKLEQEFDILDMRNNSIKDEILEHEKSKILTNNSHEVKLGKRNRDSLDISSSKKTAICNKTSELEAALAAHEASKSVVQPRSIRPVRPPGVGPPRRKPPADPFIKRKPPPPRRRMD